MKRNRLIYTFLLLMILNFNVKAVNITQFKNSDILISDKKNEEVYFVLAKKKFINNESKFEKERLLILEAKEKLTNYLNKKQGLEYEYKMKDFQVVDFFENKVESAIIGKISKNDIEKRALKKGDAEFENSLKKYITDYNGVEIISFKNKEYITSVQSKKISNLSAKEKIKETKRLNSIAEKELLNFINGETIKVEETLKGVTTIKKGKIESNEEYSKKIQVISKGFIKNQKSFSWIENGIYTYVIYLKVE